MVCTAWTKTSLFALSFDIIQLHIEQKVILQYSFIFGRMAMKDPIYLFGDLERSISFF